MNKIIEEIRPCEHCGTQTKQSKNSVQLNWILHLVLAIFTAGLWLIPFLCIVVYHAFAKVSVATGNNWVCTQCSNKPLFGGQ